MDLWVDSRYEVFVMRNLDRCDGVDKIRYCWKETPDKKLRILDYFDSGEGEHFKFTHDNSDYCLRDGVNMSKCYWGLTGS